ncbi:PREDICTED: cytochrome P450 705A5-like [Camelina sativa]|uniref:Cytochrome P450 705A5-like n=1 Tax=Camelina sativa TaxID=90675 RepID=A0ABM0YDK9_CAMSA|nr:PREDICTED: cytochrome P450 705A5-like [Camelina sativa]
MTTMVSFDFLHCFIFGLIFLFPTLFLFVYFLKKPNNGIDLPPSAPSLPIIGHLHLLLFDSIHKCFQKISSKYGPFLHLRIFHVPIVLVSSASAAHEIFNAHDTNVSFRGAIAIDECIVFGSFGYFRASCGDDWKFMRKLIMSKALGPQALERSRSIRELELERFHKNLLDKAMKKETLKIGEEARILVNNTLGKMSLGSSFSVEDNDGKKVSEYSIQLADLSRMFCVEQIFHKPLEKLGISLLKNEIMQVSNKFEELLENILVNYEEQVDKHQGTEFMDALLAAYRDEKTKYKITRNHIKALLAELFFGAGESSSSTTRWAMAEIINNPKILERLREEIDFVVGKSRLIQETYLPKLPYLQAVVKESLRLHPVGAVLPREFTQDCTIGGFHISEGTSLVINAYAVMRDPNSWKDPNEFKPERFLAASILGQEEDRKEQAMKFLPFGAGRRGCPGLNLGYTLVETTIGVLVQCFDWEIKGDKINMDEGSGLRFFLDLAHPLECIFIPRK